jgi:hypothetical protein
VTLYVNGDTQEVYTEAEVFKAFGEDVADGQAVTFEQWIEDQRDLGLLVLDIDDF